MPVQSTIDNKPFYKLLQQEKFEFLSIFYIKNRDFACLTFYKFARIEPEMKKILYFIIMVLVCTLNADAASRTENTVSRGKTVERVARSTTARNAVKTTVSSRSAKPISVLTSRNAKKNTATRTPVSRTTTTKQKTVAPRVASTQTVTETRTGAEYEQCKTAFFTCMDQFCELKNDTYRRCSCSDRIFDLQDVSETYQKAGEKITEFNENLDVVGMTYEQANAMKTASEGENALTEDKSLSKQLLQAIMNSIKGEDATVGGKYKDLNSVTISADMSNAFGMDDSGQLIASYNGATLYKAVYPKCRTAVREDCNNASLQRAINAYLMAIEQDCNTVESALTTQQKTLKASTHQSSAMLDLARVENRRQHNSDDIATCIANVENAIKSEEVCGSDYHKCLDNGQYIDVTTGAPLTGVTDFYKLDQILTFRENTDIKDQKLSSIQNNRPFVQFFENKTKKFAKDALDRCSEDADFVWQQYLDMALLDIYYAQKTKVKEIKESCFSLIANCYDNQSTAIANAMANLTGDSNLLLKPDAIVLSQAMCSDYIDSCNNMFDDKIIEGYLATKDGADTLNACRGIAHQCFSKFGGTGYSGFYLNQNGLFAKGQALDWFSLYEDPQRDSEGKIVNSKILSPCAQQVAETPACANNLEEIFGGFDKYDSGYGFCDQDCAQIDNVATAIKYRTIRPTGVATEVYYKIIDNLMNHCNGLGGYFVEYRYATQYGYKPSDFCKIDSTNPDSVFYIDSSANPVRSLVYWYHFNDEENMCPARYSDEIDTQSWGMCSCWENGGYRSKNGTSTICRPILPAISGSSSTEEELCSENVLCGTDNTGKYLCEQPRKNNSKYWCQQQVVSSDGKLCPTMKIKTENTENTEDAVKNFFCATPDGNTIIKTVTDNVPTHKQNTTNENE